MHAQIAEVLELVNVEVWKIVLQLAIAYFIVVFLQRVIENYIEFLLFRGNARLGIGVRVKINGKKGTITAYNRKFIFVDIDANGGSEDAIMIIPVSRWRYFEWTVLYHIRSSTRGPKCDE